MRPTINGRLSVCAGIYSAVKLKVNVKMGHTVVMILSFHVCLFTLYTWARAHIEKEHVSSGARVPGGNYWHA